MRAKIAATFLIAPLPSAILMALIGSKRGALALFVGAMALSWLFQLLPGMPIVMWAKRLGARRWWHYAATGMAIYGGVALVYMTWNMARGVANISSAVGVIIFSLLLFGIPSGLTAWLILRPDRPRTGRSAELEQLRHTFD